MPNTDAPLKALIEQIADPPDGRVTSRHGLVHIDPKGKEAHEDLELAQEVADFLEYQMEHDPELTLDVLYDGTLDFSGATVICWDE